MTRVHFGHCIACDQAIRPPYLSFVVSVNNAPDGNRVTSWEEVDVCSACERLTISELHRLVSAEEEDAA